MVAAGNEDLVALQAIAAVTGRLGAGAQVGQGRAGVRLGQRHGAEETAFEHRLEEALLLLVTAEHFDQVRGAHGQHRVGRGADVGRLEVGKAGT